ncbi:cobyric acid synthase [Lachnoclostridium sp. An118]|uniref:cobyric acid synthase n=1 Tax=Lachnoclostridium sp. An118 TaxID=1965547 RepID=UPI000B386C90|nr:cobyric acid synthase [Lachnoclostridium sp. An118]OUQ51140.1 cobyric acid synthase CobQ [Lachnoclostridium sp. An118]
MAKVIMIQGTMSGAGKSLLTAGLCRILKEDGLRVAPFKSQNMALNSYITAEGLEMGRAQVVQAEAAGTEPSVLMNPILLKPTTDTGSQVIVMGKVLGNMSAREYFAYKRELVPVILEAYRKLADQYDVIVVEGAGSPAEINLKENDIVNMGLARMLEAPVLLAGDIDRGGVFAQLYGTAALLEEEERARIKGLVINKFRGDKTILEPGIAMLEEKTRIPVVGVVPMIQADIEEEDSISERLREDGEKAKPGILDIAVIRLPRISNYTDMAPLESRPCAGVRYVSGARQLKEPDLVILPGSKNTMEDLRWLRMSGLEASILKLAGKGVPVFGICGGYQMMGEELEDPCGVEAGGSMRGMGLLPMRTVFGRSKVTTRTEGQTEQLEGFWKALSGRSYEGYEIHMGDTETSPELAEVQVMARRGDRVLGICRGNAAGTYIHGIFDSREMSDAILEKLAAAKGITLEAVGEGTDFRTYKESQYRLLAKELRASLDMEAVYRIIGEGL